MVAVSAAMTSLKFGSVAELAKSYKLADAHAKEFNRKSCDDVYESFVKLIRNAHLAVNDPENQLGLFLRCSDLAKIIMGKNGFATFKKRPEFGIKLNDILQRSEKLSDDLSSKYEDKKKLKSIPVAPAIINSSPSSEAKSQPHVIPSTTISPRNLVKMVERDSDKKTAVIFDFRLDKSQHSIQYPKDNLITVIPVDRELVKAGLIFSKLQMEMDISSRTLLSSRLPTVDIVVLMDDVTPPLTNNEPTNGSPACILHNALWEYNTMVKPRSKPLVMEGGFEDWKLVYPMYVRNMHASSEPEDQMDSFIRQYKKFNLDVQYPDISPMRPKPIPPTVVPAPVPHRPSPLPQNGDVHRMETTFPVDGSLSSSSISSGISSINTATGPKSSSSSTSLTNGARPLIGTATPKPYPYVPVTEDPAPISSANPLSYPGPSNGAPETKNGATIYPKANAIPSVSAHGQDIPRLPNVDRASKPSTIVANGTNGTVRHDERISPTDIRPTFPATVAAPPTSALGPKPQPALDRRTKPPEMEMNAEQHRKLLDIYRMMSENIQSNSTKRSGSRPGCTGLYNMGNTCFMSASLQALFQTPGLVDVFTKENFASRVNPSNKLGTGGVISAVFSALVDHVWSGEYTAIRPQRFLKLFADEVNSSLSDGQQHDASEFQLFLLDALHEDTNHVRHRLSFEQNYKGGVNILREADDYCEKSLRFADSPINRLFNMQSVSELQCCTCRERSVTFEESRVITVELPHPSVRSTSLTQCLTSHFSETRLEGDCRWNCPRCRSAQPSKRCTKIWKLPRILVVHLKRFSIVNGDYEKNAMPVQFDPAQLDMAPHLHDSARRQQPRDEIYRLYAVTNHRGRLNSGHYTAVASHARTGDWLRFDDESVAATSASGIDNSDAYILYYKKHNL